MASTINASTTGLGGIITTGDNSGALALQTAGTTAVTINSSQNVGIGTTSPTTILQASSATPVITVTSTGLTSSSQDFTTNGAAQRTTIGVERSTGGGLFVGSSAYAAVFGSAGASSTQFASNNTVRMTLDTSGNVQTYGTISVGNATPSTSGAGITFPATQSASSDANTLDDYEEGTFTPTVFFGGTQMSGGSVTAIGSYTKIGRVVSYLVDVAISTVGTGSGNMQIKGMPFSVTSGTNAYPCPACESEALTSGIANFVPLLPPGQSYFDMYYNWNGTAGPSNVSFSLIKNGSGFRLTGLYFTS